MHLPSNEWLVKITKLESAHLKSNKQYVVNKINCSENHRNTANTKYYRNNVYFMIYVPIVYYNYMYTKLDTIKFK